MDMPQDPVFRLYPTCRLVRGGAYSAIYDLDRRQIFRFETAYVTVFELCVEDGIRQSEIAGLEPTVRAKVLEALDFLQSRELGRYLDESSASWLAPFSDRWDSPHSILNAIVDVDEAEHDWPAVIAALDAQQCRALQIRGFSSVLTPEAALRVLEAVSGAGISRVELLARWSPAWAQTSWLDLFARFRNLQLIRLHSAPAEGQLDTGGNPVLAGRRVTFETATLTSAAHCGSIGEGSLATPTARLYGELRRFNGCLNRKVSVRADGQICNCPSMRATYGADLGQLREIVSSAAFQAPWAIRKDLIDVCGGCEFRYVCTDCRAYLEDDLSRAKPVRCRYDPVSGQWAARPAARPAAVVATD